MHRPTRTRPAAVLAVVAVVAIVAIVAVVVAAAVGIARAHRSAERTPAAAPSATNGATVALPAGWRWVSSLGVQLAVPSSWTVANDAGCDGPDTLVRGGGAISLVGCGGDRTVRRAVVTIARPRLAAGLTEGRNRHAWLSPDRMTEVVGAGPDGALLDRVFGTLRAVGVDWAGCPTAPTSPAWDRVRHGPAIRAGSLEDVVVCVYDTVETPVRLAASTVLRGPAAASVAAALAHAAPGANDDQPESMCMRGEPEMFVAHLHLAGSQGSTPAVLHFAGCTGRYAATPSGESHITGQLLHAVLGSLNIGYVYGSAGISDR